MAASHAQTSGESPCSKEQTWDRSTRIIEMVVAGMWSEIEGEVCAKCSTFWGGNRCDQSGSPKGGPRGVTEVVPEAVPEVGKPFIYAVELTSRKLWSRLGTPTLVTHFGPPLGAPGGARISRHVPEIAQIHFCWFPPSDSPLAWKKRRGLLPQKRHPPPGDMGQSRFSQCKSWIASVVQVNTLFTVLRSASSKVRDTFF